MNFHNEIRGIPTARSAIPLYFWFANVVNFTLPICQDLLQKHNESAYRLEYMSTNYGNLPLNSTVTRKEVIFIKAELLQVGIFFFIRLFA